MSAKKSSPRGPRSSGRPSKHVPVDWEEFDAALYGFLLAHLRRLGRVFRSRPAYEIHIHCNADYGQVFPYLDVRPQTVGRRKIRFPGYPTHPPRKPDGLAYTLDGWDFVELKPDQSRSAARRWWDCSVAFAQRVSELSSKDYDAAKELTTEFLHRACTVALRLEKDTRFEFVRKEPCWVLFVGDHDETESDSWRRLLEARVELTPPWEEGNAWPINGRQPEIASAIFALASEYHARKQLPEAASLLREAVARLPELRGASAGRVKGTDVELPIPENRACAMAYLAVAERRFWEEERTEKAIKYALRFDAGLADAYYFRAKIRSALTNQPRVLNPAVKDLDRAISLDGGRPEYFALRAELRTRPRYPFWEQALADYTRAHELDPFNQQWLMRRAEVRQQLEDHAGAIDDYSAVFRLHHSVVSWEVRDALRGRAKCLQKIGRVRQAVRDWDRLIKYSEHAEDFHNRAACYRVLGNRKRAEADEQAARKLAQDEEE
jgi:tetratricopeptide (TPR) repeat protein